MFSKFFLSLSAAKKIAVTALFVAICVVVNFLSIDVTPSNKITFTYAFCFFSGAILGGVPAFLIGFLGDTIAFLIYPSGVFWFFGVTLGAFAFLCGLGMNLFKTDTLRKRYLWAAVTLVLSYLLITVFLNTLVNYYYVKIFVWFGEVKKPFLVYFAGRIGFQSIIYAANVALCMILLPFLQKLPFFRKQLQNNE